MDILSNSGALQRIVSRHGLRMDYTTGPSSYIACCRVRKALLNDLSDDMLKAYAERRGYAKQTRLDNVLDKLVRRVDKLPSVSIAFIHQVLQDEGVERMVEELNKPLKEITRSTN